MRIVSSVLSIGTSHPARSVNSPRLFISAWWCAMAGLTFLPATFRAWSADCISPPPGLAAWWPGDGDANDIVGTNNGTLLNGATFAPGEVGSAFSFDGISQCVQIPYSQTLASSNYSFEAWVKPLAQVSNSLNQSLIFGQSYGRHLIARRGTSGVIIGFYFATSTVNFFGAVSTSEIPIGQFTHLVGTWDGTTVRLYINGVLNAQNTPGVSPVDPGCAFSIGGFGNNCGYVGQFFNGLIDEVSYYNRALSGGEVQAIYLADGGGKCKVCRPHAATASSVMANGFVLGANMTDGGCGYTNTPSVRIIDGGGSGACAVAVVSNGVVIAVNVLDAGYGYTNTPLVVIGPPFIPNPVLGIAPMSFLTFSDLTVGGTYQMQRSVGWYWTNQPVSFTATDAIYTQMLAGVAGSGDYRLALNPVPAQAFATAQVVNGFVVGAAVTSGGSGYVTSPAISIVGGGGAGATAVSHISGGVVTGISITEAGIGCATRRCGIADGAAGDAGGCHQPGTL